MPSMLARARQRAKDERPSGFAPFTATTLEGEWLLYVAQNAYELVTGEEWDRRTRYSFGSYSNRDGWPRRG
ncbi:hypothetical protein ABH925_002173 [Streptacidiphilus sp. EB129]|jgi:hypothetical protein